MKQFRTFSIYFLLLIFTACSQSENKNQVSQNENEVTPDQQFEQKLDSLENAEQRPELLAEKEQTHLDYGIYLIYNADPSSMRENANKALRQFIEVLKINPENDKATAEIEQILGIYRTFPDRKPEEDVAEDLRALGFEI